MRAQVLVRFSRALYFAVLRASKDQALTREAPLSLIPNDNLNHDDPFCGVVTAVILGTKPSVLVVCTVHI